MTIREATPADTDGLVAMAAHFLADSPYVAFIPTNPDRLAALVDTCLRLGTIIVAETADGCQNALGPHALQGMFAVVAVEHPFSGARYAEEVAWWVHPRCRSGTTGPRLLVRGQEWAEAHGLPFLKVGAPLPSTVGAFYERLGYQAVETAYIKRFT